MERALLSANSARARLVTVLFAAAAASVLGSATVAAFGSLVIEYRNPASASLCEVHVLPPGTDCADDGGARLQGFAEQEATGSYRFVAPGHVESVSAEDVTGLPVPFVITSVFGRQVCSVSCETFIGWGYEAQLSINPADLTPQELAVHRGSPSATRGYFDVRYT